MTPELLQNIAMFVAAVKMLTPVILLGLLVLFVVSNLL